MKWFVWVLLYFICASSAGAQTVDKFNAAMPKYGMVKTIILAPGKQPGLNLTGHSNERYVITDQVIFTSSIKLGNTFNITLDGRGSVKGYGFVYAGTGDVFTSGQGNNINDSVFCFDFGTTATMAFDAVTKIYSLGTTVLTYNGTPQTLVYAGLYVEDYHIGPGVWLFQGAWDLVNTYRMVMAGLTFNAGIFDCDTLHEFQPTHAVSCYALHMTNTLVRGNAKFGNTDYGTIFVDGGNAQITNFHRSGKVYGYAIRVVICVLAGLPYDQTCIFKNIVDANSTRYGTLDARVEPTWFVNTSAIPITAEDYYFQNNTSIYKIDAAQFYVTNAVMMGALKDDKGKKWTAHILNNYAAGAANNLGANGSSLIKNNSNGDIILDSMNNIDVAPGKPVPGYLDSNYYPLPGSPLALRGIGAAINHITPLPPLPIPTVCPLIDSIKIFFSDGTIIKK